MKTKKLISIILTALMLMTCFSSAFSAFAAEDDIKALTDLIYAYNGDLTVAEPAAEDLEAYNEMVNAFNALSAEERDNLDVIAFDKLLLTVYDREVAILKAGGMSNGNAMKQAHAKAEAVITMPSYVATAAALYTEVSNINSQAKFDAFVENLKAAPVNAAILAGGYYKSYNSFRYAIHNDKYGAELVLLAADKLSTVTEKADSANKPSSPKSVSKPNVSKFNGVDDPAYIAAYEAYLAYKEAQAQYYADLYAFEFEKHYLPHLKVLTEACPYFSFVYDICKNTIEAKRNFNENEDTAKIAEVMAVYNTLSPAQKGWFEAVDGTAAFAEKVENGVTDFGIEYTYKRYKTIELIDFCVSMEFYYTIKNFEDTVAEIAIPCTNADIAKAKAAYNEVPESLRNTISVDAKTKYSEILACVGPEDAVDNEPALDAFVESEVSYKDISGKKAEALINSIFDLVLDATGTADFKTFIDSNVFTNKTVIALAGAIYDLLAEETDGLIDVTPADMVKELTEEKFAGAVAAFEAAGESWADVEINNGDLGFTDGDVEGFLDATSAMLRGASLLHIALKLENTADVKEGTYSYGAYEELIDVFEILDLRSVMSSGEYTDYVNAAENKNDAKFRAILAPIAYLLVDIGNDPVNTLLDVLPKLAYAIDSGLVSTQINKLLSMFQIIEISPVDLTTAGIYTILNDELLTPQSINLSEEEFTALIEALSGCGKAVKKDSVKRGLNYRMGISSDSEKAAAVLLTWILDIASENTELVNVLLATLVGENVFIGIILKLAVTLSTTVIPRRVVFNLMSIFISIAKAFTSVLTIF